jgi:hypothetical protein
MKRFDISNAASNLLVLFSVIVAVAAMLLGDKLDMFLSTVALKGVILVEDLPGYLATLLG